MLLGFVRGLQIHRIEQPFEYRPEEEPPEGWHCDEGQGQGIGHEGPQFERQQGPYSGYWLHLGACSEFVQCTAG